MDRIVMQNTMARAAGLTYGKWKALHPESEIIVEEPVELEDLRPCQYCGKPIPHEPVKKGSNEQYKKKLYCSERCKVAAHRRRIGIPERGAQKDKKDTRKKPGKCQWCGQQIPERNERGRKNRWDMRYCSDNCRMERDYHKTLGDAVCAMKA